MDLDIGKPKIDLREQPTITCEKCGGIFFREVTILKRVSRLLTGTPQDTDVPFLINQYNPSGHVNKDQNPFTEDEQ